MTCDYCKPSTTLPCLSCGSVITGQDPELMKIAKLVSDMPPLPSDEESINLWAADLTKDLMKFKD